LNGVDDDLDGLTDCADTDCAQLGYACVEIPNGWDGPVALQTDKDPPEPCSAPWTVEQANGGINPIAPPGATCPSCNCDPSANAVCGMDVLFYDQPGCVGNTQADVLSADGTCINVGMQSFGPQSVRATSGFSVTSGDCNPVSSGTESFPDPIWEVPARACRAIVLRAGCASDEVCAPPTNDGSVCVVREGSQACPAAFGDRTVIYKNIDDGRTCTACSCSPPSGNCGGSEISVEDPSGGCPGVGDVISTACVAVPVHPTFETFSLESWVSSVNATCSPEGGDPTGNLTAAGPVTVCCSVN